jgi:cell division protein FtsB
MREPGISPDAQVYRRPALPQRALLWSLVIICVALALSLGGELWMRHTVDEQISAQQRHNQQLQRQIEDTRRAIQAASSPDAIEQQARSWGYTRPGDQPVIIVTPAP